MSQYVWCRTSCQTPRKHAHPEPSNCAKFDVTLGSEKDDRIVNATWNSDGIDCVVSVNVATLRKMLEVAESYKPGATV